MIAYSNFTTTRMSKSSLKTKVTQTLLVLFLICDMFQNGIAQQNPNTIKFDEALMAQFDLRDENRYLIKFVSQADLSRAKSFQKKEIRGQFVFRNLNEVSDRDQADVISFLKNQKISYRIFSIVNALVVKTDLQTAMTIAKFQNVQKLISDPDIYFGEPFENVNQNMRGPVVPEWGILNIGADQVWDMGYRGDGVVIAGADTGFDWQNPTLINKYRGLSNDTVIHDYHWHDAIHELSPLNEDPINEESNNPCGLSTIVPCDDDGHGTHTMGTMVGSDSMNAIGVAPNAKWIACRNMERGWGSPSSYIECFEFFLAPTDLNGENADPTLAPHVINNSWRCPEMEGCNLDNFGLIQTAIRNLRAAGIMVVASAGNEGPGCETVSSPPAMFEESFSVAAYRSNDTIAGFSSRGPVTVDSSFILKPDIAAPGVNVRSVVLNGNFANLSGTSMAGPHVSGAVALLINANPELAGQVETIEEILRETARPMTTPQNCGDITGDQVPNHTYGYGNLNVLAAVERVLEMTTSVDPSLKQNALKIYPNPAKNIVHWEIESDGHIESIRLYQFNGQLVHLEEPGQSTKGQLSVEHLQAGIYLFQMRNINGIYTSKLVLSGSH